MDGCPSVFRRGEGVKAVRVDLKLFYRGFLLYPASQLYCGAGGAFGLSGGANGDTGTPICPILGPYISSWYSNRYSLGIKENNSSEAIGHALRIYSACLTVAAGSGR